MKCAAHVAEPNGPAKDRLRGGQSQADDHLRPDRVELRLQPGLAGGELRRVRLFMLPAFPLRLPFEMFHGIRNIRLAARDVGFDQRLIQ